MQFNLSCNLIWVQGREFSVFDFHSQLIEPVNEVSWAGATGLPLLLDRARDLPEVGVGGWRDVTHLGHPSPSLEQVHLQTSRRGGDLKLLEQRLAVLEHFIVRVFI